MSDNFFDEQFILPEVQEKFWILHADLDSFYASVEQKLHPELKGKPVIVGPNPKLGAKRGVVLTCSYEARKFGVKSAMPILQAYKLCPDAHYSFSGFEAYSEQSNLVMATIREQCHDKNVSQVGIDEAYIDISNLTNITDAESVRMFCINLQTVIYEKTELPVSIGASHTKSIAKISSQLAKPKGVKVIAKAKFREELDSLPINVISGVGKKTYQILKDQGFNLIKDVTKYSYTNVPKNIQWIWLIAHGIRIPGSLRQSNHSHSKERTFHEDLNDNLLLRKTLRNLINNLLDELEQEFRTITIKLRTSNFQTFTRSRTFPFYISPTQLDHRKLCISTANTLLNDVLSNHSYRLIGVKASSFQSPGIRQTNLVEFLSK